MYMIGVPLMVENLYRSDLNRVLEELEKLDAKRVLLACGTYLMDRVERDRIRALAKEYCTFFKSHGYEVGIWIWTFWINGENEFMHMKSNSGVVNKEFYCPSDENFRKFAADYVKEFAECGVDLIQFDDDFRYGYLDGGFCCICERK